MKVLQNIQNNNGMQLSSQGSPLTKGLEIIFNIGTSQLFRAAKDFILLSDEDVATRVTLRLNQVGITQAMG